MFHLIYIGAANVEADTPIKPETQVITPKIRGILLKLTVLRLFNFNRIQKNYCSGVCSLE